MTWDETQEAVGVRPSAGDPALDSIIQGWARLFAHLVVVVVVTVAIVMPFAGLAFALAVGAYLRAGDAHVRNRRAGLLRVLAGPLAAPLDLLRGTVLALVVVPYAAVAAVAVPLLIVAVGAVGVKIYPLVAAAWGAGAGAYVLLAGPGVRTPRRYLVRLFTAVAAEPRRIAVIGWLLCPLTIAAVAGAIVLQPRFGPMYELKNSIAQELTRFQNSL